MKKMKSNVYDIQLTMRRGDIHFDVDYVMAGSTRDDAINNAMLAFRSLDRVSVLVSLYATCTGVAYGPYSRSLD